jgi:hypothetical protein
MQRDRFFVDADGGGKWVLIRQGAARPLRSFRLKQEAVRYGRDLARKRGNSQLVVKGRNHDIQTEWTYDRDPRRHPG